MSLVAAFLWNKSNLSIAALIFDDKSMQVLSRPQIYYLPSYSFRFKRMTRQYINEFFKQLTELSISQQENIKIEYKILLMTRRWRYMKPAKESKYVYKIFQNAALKASKKIPALTLQPQARAKLTGKHLLAFNRKLRLLNLVSRKINTRFEYNLWAVALHASNKTYEQILAAIGRKFMEAFWSTS